MTSRRVLNTLYIAVALLINLSSAQPDCVTSVDCPANKVVCQADLICGPCSSAIDCITMYSNQPICKSGVCKPCTSDADCSFMAPRSFACNTTSGGCQVTNIIAVNTTLPGAIAVGIFYALFASGVIVVLFLTVCVPEVQELRTKRSGNSTALSSHGTQSVTSDT